MKRRVVRGSSHSCSIHHHQTQPETSAHHQPLKPSCCSFSEACQRHCRDPSLAAELWHTCPPPATCAALMPDPSAAAVCEEASCEGRPQCAHTHKPHDTPRPPALSSRFCLPSIRQIDEPPSMYRVDRSVAPTPSHKAKLPVHASGGLLCSPIARPRLPRTVPPPRRPRPGGIAPAAAHATLPCGTLTPTTRPQSTR